MQTTTVDIPSIKVGLDAQDFWNVLADHSLDSSLLFQIAGLKMGMNLIYGTV